MKSRARIAQNSTAGTIAERRRGPGSTPVEPVASLAEQAEYLRDLFGPKLTAIMVEADDLEEIGSWVRGESRPGPTIERHLAEAYGVARRLGGLESPQAVRAWFVGMNPELDDRAPAEVIASEPELVAEAADIFLATG